MFIIGKNAGEHSAAVSTGTQRLRRRPTQDGIFETNLMADSVSVPGSKSSKFAQPRIIPWSNVSEENLIRDHPRYQDNNVSFLKV